MNKLDKKQIKRNYQRYASSYDVHAVVYTEIAKRLMERLDMIKINPKKILDLGSGTGVISKQLQARYPDAEIISYDLSWAMLALDDESDIRVNGDAENLCFAEAQFDLVISNLMLPWCDDHAKVFAEIRSVLHPQGLFLFASFGPDTLKELRSAWSQVDNVGHVHLFFDMHDVGDMLSQSGLADPVMDVERLEVVYQNLEQALFELKLTGSANALSSRCKTLLTPRRYEKFKQQCPATSVSLTYEVIFGHAWFANVNNKVKNEFFITVDEIKVLIK